MTAAAEKVEKGKTGGGKTSDEKGHATTAAPEKRRALGRGLDALLPGGPRVVGGTAVRPPGAAPVSAPPSSSQVGGVGQREPSSAEAGAPAGVGTTPLKPKDNLNGAPSVAGQVSGAERREPSSVEAGASAGVRTTPLKPKDGLHGAPSVAGQVSGAERREPSSVEAASPSGVVTAPLKPTPGLDGAPSGDGESFEGVEVRELPLELIDKNPYQTRHFTEEDQDELIELGRSIQAQGLIQPITVREGKDGRFVLIAGDRRTRAARWAGLTTIPAIVWEVSEQEAAEMTIIENLMREDLNCMDQTRAFILLSQKFLMTQADIAARVGMSRESVSNYMRLARLPSEVQDYLVSGELEFSHARQLLKLEDDATVLKVAQRIVKERIPVWELEEMMLGGVPAAFKVADGDKQKRGARWVDPNVKAAQRDLERVLGMRVRIRDRNNKGRIQIEYATLEDFDRVVKMLTGK